MPPAAKADALETYRAKRRFDETSEPAGARPGRKAGHSYLIQKHDSRRLHYDFRLELDGVLLSWAVTRGPSYNTKDRRLAVRTEDHPLEYGGFEGTIPQGNYGGGTVMLWDTGSWEPLGDPRDGLEKGKLVFLLHGERLRGRWGLIRMQPRPKEKHENWLLIKENDDYANTNPDLLEQATTSVVSHRDLAGIAGGDSPEWHSRSGKLPGYRPPQLATLVDAPPEDEDWRFEIKYDGYRAQIAANGQDVKIYTRSGLDWTEKFPAVAQAVAKLNLPGALLDSEITVLDETGRSDFGALVQALETGKGALTCFVFDLLENAGEDLTKQPLQVRQAALDKLLGKPKRNAVIQRSEQFHAAGKSAAALLKTACERGLEGLIAKRVSAPYHAGRQDSWLKIKCRHEQEFLIIGFAASEKNRPFSSLLMGVQETSGIRYAGRVGTGFDDRTLVQLATLRDQHKTSKPAAPNIPPAMQRNVTWVKPVLVAQIAFAGWTPDNNIRHGAYLGLRNDKPPKDIIKETPKQVKTVSQPDKAEIDGTTISHAGKIVYEDAGISKADIAAYLHAAAKLMLPFTAGRFIILLRAPSGPDHKTFYQRHPAAGFGDAWLHASFNKSDGGTEDYIYFDKPEALVAAVQMNTLEFHIWGSKLAAIDQPDRIVFDLDPDPGVDFAAVKSAAFRLRDVLEALDLQSLPLLSGGKGIHVVVPIKPSYEWPVIKAFAHNLSHRMVADAEQKFIATMSKAKRANKIFIDHFRNERGATAIAPFSPRARPGAPVAWPLDWAGLTSIRAANEFTLPDAAGRLAAGETPWADYRKIRQSLKASALRALDVAI
jgi:bifunctional non-homologous end joining protein LigD